LALLSLDPNEPFSALVAVGEWLAADDERYLRIESSGSTGTPKGIFLSREAMKASASASNIRLGGPGQWLLALPVSYVAGAQVLVRSHLSDTHPVMMNLNVPFAAEGFARSASLMTGSRRYVSLVPTQLMRIADAIERDNFVLEQLRRFDAILVGGQAPQAALVAVLRELGVNVVVTYGSTETAGGCVYDGVALDGVEAALAADGRVRLRGPVLAAFTGSEDAPIPVAGPDGWLQTNDLGEFDGDGRLHVIGRADRVIASGGIKISLDRVEALAGLTTGVTELAAAPIDDPEWGQRVGIAYTGSPEVADEIARALADELGPAGRPIRVLRVDALPKLPNSKIDLLAVKNLVNQPQEPK
jgi:O-succinylbenzoic acid--CoA ligase